MRAAMGEPYAEGFPVRAFGEYNSNGLVLLLFDHFPTISVSSRQTFKYQVYGLQPKQ
jgi:hypothetical protein